MKKNTRYLIFAAVFAVLAALIVLVLTFLYRNNDFFRSLFDGTMTAKSQLATGNDIRETAKTVESISRTAAPLSLFILIFILVLQVLAFMVAAAVFSDLKHSREAVAIRLKKLENADLFLDLPLYFGLLGTVSSFIVMSFNPGISRLIAYSSTLVGIIFSVILRLTLQYPLKQALISLAASEDMQADAEPSAPPKPLAPPDREKDFAPAVKPEDRAQADREKDFAPAVKPEKFAPAAFSDEGKSSGEKKKAAGNSTKSEKETKK